MRYTYAACAYAAFVAASLWGVIFLADRGRLPTVDSTRSGPAWSAVLIDLGLWLLFGLQHSAMARSAVKQRLTRVAPGRLERCTYVLITGLALGLLFWQWRALPTTIWEIDAQPWVVCVWTVYGAGWVIAVAATFMTDHGEFLGLRPAGLLVGRPFPPTSQQRLGRPHGGHHQPRPHAATCALPWARGRKHRGHRGSIDEGPSRLPHKHGDLDSRRRRYVRSAVGDCFLRPPVGRGQVRIGWRCGDRGSGRPLRRRG